MSKFIANSFQLPNAFVDEMLCKLSGNACKIYLLIVRKTRGWHKEADRISYSQIQKYTGINHRATVSKAIDELLEIGLISVQKGNEKSMSEYRLNDDFCGSKNEQEAGSKNEPVKKCTSSKNEPTGSKNEQEAGSKNEHTEIHYIKNTKEKYREYDTHTHENLENSQTAKPNKSTGKSPSAKKFITADELVSLGVDEQVANDYLATRKTKLTQTALSGIAKQATLAGVSLAKAIEFACEMGWQSFKADWYQNAQTKFGNPQPTNRMDELRHMANTNPTNVFVDDLPPNFDALGVNYE
ncbi:replication protein [Moraxella bovis]|uniref:Replication protein n=1 Tax=Moraxella bovis TaxID=476 RepID=A0ABY6MAG7_MORBO|nr:replication protein [Moraxella bovis]UYZ69991.1 replication protein [Moraxella bovis]UYZ90354.1 replication protein [Moraxella bovis]UYZ96629.1 replication protein [Moraxella bovis]UYZ97035.1 replication protein [Moraxella bovis]UZA04505.1 replication protein [Moraxella bovis]